MKKSETWIGYIVWVAFLVGSIALILSQAYPYLLSLKKKNDIEDAVNFLTKLKNDAEFLSFTGYGSEFSYSLNFNDAYIVVYENESIVQLRFKTENFPFRAEDFETKDVKAYFDFDQLVLEVSLPKRFLLTFSEKAKGNFYLRNKGEGFILTNKKGFFIDLGYSLKPLDPYLSFEFNFSTNYSGKWEDIWLIIKEENNLINPLEFYFFEKVTNAILNFSDNERKSKLLNLEFNLFTDLGNYWKKNIELEVPYNSRVNVSFVFDDVKAAYLYLNFTYAGKRYILGFNKSLNCTNNVNTQPLPIGTGQSAATLAVIGSGSSGSNYNITIPSECILVGKKKSCVDAYIVGNTGFNICNITIRFYDLPTYTNYSISYYYAEDDGSESQSTTWRVFTPYILNCSSSGSNLNCGEFWKNSGNTYNNTFNFRGNILVTQCNKNSKKCGLNNFLKKCYSVESGFLKIYSNNLLNDFNDC